MAFVKLDVGILDSTLWVDKDAREIFITALLMAVPREYPNPVPQYGVVGNDIVQTGFVAPPGWYGFVAAAGSGIIRRCGMDEEAGKLALERLGEPEEGSRSGAHAGRRMIRMDGGYIILNYIKYRDKDHTAAIRQKRYRERHAVTSASNAVTVTPVTHTEAEAEAYKPKPLSEEARRKFLIEQAKTLAKQKRL